MPTSGKVLLEKFRNKDGWEELPPVEVIKNTINSFSGTCDELDIVKFLLEENKFDTVALDEVTKTLIQKSLSEWKFAKIAVELVLHMQSISEEGAMVRDNYIKNLQSTYEDCHKNISNKIQAWMGCVSLLVHSSVNIVLHGGVPIKALVFKSYESIKSLMHLSATPDEVECSSHLVALCWETLLTLDDGEVVDLLSHMKQIVVEGRCSNLEMLFRAPDEIAATIYSLHDFHLNRV